MTLWPKTVKYHLKDHSDPHIAPLEISVLRDINFWDNILDVVLKVNPSLDFLQYHSQMSKGSSLKQTFGPESNLNGRSMPNLLKWNFWLLKIWQIYIDVSSSIWTIQSECLNIFVFFKFYSINFWSMGNLLKWNFWLLPFASQISLSHCLSPKLGLLMMRRWWGKTFWNLPRFVFSTLNNISRSFHI